MTHVPRALLLVSLVVLAACAQTPPAAEVSASGAAPAAASGAPSASAATERVICEDTPLTGSRLITPRRCRTVSSTDEPQREAAQAINEGRQNQAMPRR